MDAVNSDAFVAVHGARSIGAAEKGRSGQSEQNNPTSQLDRLSRAATARQQHKSLWTDVFKEPRHV